MEDIQPGKLIYAILQSNSKGERFVGDTIVRVTLVNGLLAGLYQLDITLVAEDGPYCLNYPMYSTLQNSTANGKWDTAKMGICHNV